MVLKNTWQISCAMYHSLDVYFTRLNTVKDKMFLEALDKAYSQSCQAGLVGVKWSTELRERQQQLTGLFDGS
jgi:hypothetical protein